MLLFCLIYFLCYHFPHQLSETARTYSAATLAAASRLLLELNRRHATVCILGRTRLKEGEFHRAERTKELLFAVFRHLKLLLQTGLIFIHLGLLDVSVFARVSPRLGEHTGPLRKQVTPELAAQA